MGPTSIFSLLLPPADAILTIARLALAVTGAIFVVVSALIVYAAIRYRRRPGSGII